MWETVYSLLSHISPSYTAAFSRELAHQLARYVVYAMALITSSPLVLGYSQTTSESQPKWYVHVSTMSMTIFTQLNHMHLPLYIVI